MALHIWYFPDVSGLIMTADDFFLACLACACFLLVGVQISFVSAQKASSYPKRININRNLNDELMKKIVKSDEIGLSFRSIAA
jgi:hypothetical protein